MADRYFVGAGNWDASDTSVWSTSSGGATGASVPTSTDNVFFDANSGACAVTATANCADLDFNGYTATFSGSAALNIYGSLTFGSGMTRTFTGNITFASTSTGETLTFNGITTASDVMFFGAGGEWTLQDTWNAGSGDIEIEQGSFDTNGQTLTCTIFNWSGSTSTTSVSLGASAITCERWTRSSTTNATVSPGTANITVSGSTTFYFGGYTYDTVTFTGNGYLADTSTFGSLTITGLASKTANFRFAAAQTITGTLTINGNSVTNRIIVRSSSLGTSRTLTAATTSLSNVDFQDITGAGAASWSGTSIGNALGNSGITFTTPVTRYSVAAGNWSSTSTWSASAGGSAGASVPLCHDDVVLDSYAGGGTITADMPRMGANIDCASGAFAGTLDLSATNYIYGSLTLHDEMALAADNTYLAGRGSHTLTMAGRSWTWNLTVNAPGGTYTLQDDFTTSGTFYLSNGTFDANDNNLDLGNDFSFFGGTLYMGNGTWTVTDNNFQIYNGIDALYCEGSTIVIEGDGTSIYDFDGGDNTFNNLVFAGSGVCTFTVRGSNTFNTISSTKTVAFTIKFYSGETQTMSDWTVEGSSGNIITITSNDTNTHTLTLTGGGLVASDYLNIQHSIATPSDTWFAGPNSTDNQATATAGSGWTFTDPNYARYNFATYT